MGVWKEDTDTRTSILTYQHASYTSIHLSVRALREHSSVASLYQLPLSFPCFLSWAIRAPFLIKIIRFCLQIVFEDDAKPIRAHSCRKSGALRAQSARIYLPHYCTASDRVSAVKSNPLSFYSYISRLFRAQRKIWRRIDGCSWLLLSVKDVYPTPKAFFVTGLRCYDGLSYRVIDLTLSSCASRFVLVNMIL